MGGSRRAAGRVGAGAVPTAVPAAPAVLVALIVLVCAVTTACGAPAPPPGGPSSGGPPSGGPAASAQAPPAPPAPSVKPYCDTVLRVQAEQTAPRAGQGGVAAASEATRRRLAALVATAPPEISAEWRALQGLTEQALGSLAATGGNPNLIDRAALARLEAQSRPAVERIERVTEARCGITFRPPG